MCERGQTTLDFTFGISVFLLTVIFVFSFVPGLLSPFAGSGSDHPVTANRIADDLVQDRLAVDGDPYTLRDTASLSDNMDDEDESLPPGTRVNVTLSKPNGRREADEITASYGPA
ncbi:DUF7287 family protein, partial [Halarchaeum acidiphilum]